MSHFIRIVKTTAVSFYLLVTSGCFVFMNMDLVSSKSPYQEKVLEGASSWWTDEKVALIDLHGLLAKRSGSSSFLSTQPGPDPVSDLKESLNRAAADSDVKAVVLRINSPGGFVSWCDVMYRHVKQFKEKTGKPVIASITGMGASGGYYVACATDAIYASPASTVGSIGVIALFLNLEELASKIGVETQVIKSGAKKDMGGLWREMTDSEKKVAQDMIDEFYGQFVDCVDENRENLSRDEILKLADGRLYTAKQAFENGLIDKIAYLEEAIDSAMCTAQIDDAMIITYKRNYEYKNNIYSAAPQSPPEVHINLSLDKIAGEMPSGFYYLWQGGW